MLAVGPHPHLNDTKWLTELHFFHCARAFLVPPGLRTHPQDGVVRARCVKSRPPRDTLRASDGAFVVLKRANASAAARVSELVQQKTSAKVANIVGGRGKGGCGGLGISLFLHWFSSQLNKLLSS